MATSGKDAFTTESVHVGLNTGFFDIAGLGDGKLKLYNTFQYVNESDLLYYVLYVYKQLNLDTQNTPLYVFGEQSTASGYMDILKQYVRKTDFASDADIPELSAGLHQLNRTKFLNLLNVQSCVLSAENMVAGE